MHQTPYRESTNATHATRPRPLEHHRVWYASLILCGACILMFLAQAFLGTDAFDLNVALTSSQPWRIATAIFAHAGIVHLLSNLFALALFGLILEGRIGSRRVFWTFMLSGIAINIIIAGFGLYDSSLGASGAIFTLLGALVMLRPRMTVWVDMIPLPMALAGIVWALQDILGIFYPSGVANMAHLIGLAFGLALGIMWRKQFADHNLTRRRSPDDDALDRALDQWEKRNMR